MSNIIIPGESGKNEEQQFSLEDMGIPTSVIRPEVAQKLKDLQLPSDETQRLAREDAKQRVMDRINKVMTGKGSKLTFSFNTPTNTTERKVGDKWVDETGNEWEQRSWGKMRLPKIDKGELEREGVLMPRLCPKCGKQMKHHLDRKFWTFHKMCFDCVTEFETKLRIQGTYEEYERRRLKANMRAYYQEVKNSMEDYINSLNATYVNEFGDIERWDKVDADYVRSLLREDLKKFQTEFEDYFKEPIEHLENNDGMEGYSQESSQ